MRTGTLWLLNINIPNPAQGVMKNRSSMPSEESDLVLLEYTIHNAPSELILPEAHLHINYHPKGSLLMNLNVDGQIEALIQTRYILSEQGASAGPGTVRFNPFPSVVCIPSADKTVAIIDE